MAEETVVVLHGSASVLGLPNVVAGFSSRDFDDLLLSLEIDIRSFVATPLPLPAPTSKAPSIDALRTDLAGRLVGDFPAPKISDA